MLLKSAAPDPQGEQVGDLVCSFVCRQTLPGERAIDADIGQRPRHALEALAGRCHGLAHERGEVVIELGQLLVENRQFPAVAARALQIGETLVTGEQLVGEPLDARAGRAAAGENGVGRTSAKVNWPQARITSS